MLDQGRAVHMLLAKTNAEKEQGSQQEGPLVMILKENQIVVPKKDESSVDNILVYCGSMEERPNHLKPIVDTLRDQQLFGKQSKCSFIGWKVILLILVMFLLGYVVGNTLSKHCDVITALDDHLLGVESMKNYNETNVNLLKCLGYVHVIQVGKVFYM